MGPIIARGARTVQKHEATVGNTDEGKKKGVGRGGTGEAAAYAVYDVEPLGYTLTFGRARPPSNFTVPVIFANSV